MTSNDLKLIPLDTRDLNSIGFADVSDYPTGFTPTNVTFEVTPPGFPKINATFTAKAANVYYADDLGIGLDNCTPLPDGIYTVKLSMNPSLNLSIEKSFLRTDAIWCKYANTFASIDLECSCSSEKILAEKNKLRQAKLLILGATASANRKDYTSSFKMYRKAENILNNLVKCNCK